MMTPEQMAELRRKHYNATAVGLRLPNPELMIIRVKPDFPRPPHKPGQYTSLGLGYWEPRVPDCQEEELTPEQQTRLARRAYSISCSVLDDDNRLLDLARTDYIEFYIVLVRSSDRPQAPALTPRLFVLKEGDRLFLQEKITGNFTLDPVKPDDTVVFLATGTGEAPHNYLLWELLHRQHRGRIVSVCCVRYLADLGYLPIQQELMRQFPNYTYLSLTTREPSQAGKKVYVQDLIQSGELERVLGSPLDPDHTHVYLCGNPNMIGVPIKDPATGARGYPKPLGVIEILESRGFRVDQPQAKIKGNIHFEEYW